MLPAPYTLRMDPDRIAAVLEHLTLDEAAEMLRALAIFERCGAIQRTEAAAWRDAIQVRAAELRVAEAVEA
jgi:hypothetical protein